MTESGRRGDGYLVSEADARSFRERGFVTLRSVLSEAELRELDPIYDRFARGEVKGMRRDLCDMSADYHTPFEDFALVNAMLPRLYWPALQGNVYERVSLHIARQLIGDGIGLDYDQFLSKKPGCPRAAFAWHQDMGYWPAQTPDTRTATISLALTDATPENGCIEFVPGSHLPRKLWPHSPRLGSGEANADRDKAHTLVLRLDEGVERVRQPVKRGDVTVHDEWIVHGSGGNPSPRWRKTYVVAYRSLATIAYERSIGFTHSHNDVVNWKTLLDLA